LVVRMLILALSTVVPEPAKAVKEMKKRLKYKNNRQYFMN
jgi:hypothetical protein